MKRSFLKLISIAAVAACLAFGCGADEGTDSIIDSEVTSIDEENNKKEETEVDEKKDVQIEHSGDDIDTESEAVNVDGNTMSVRIYYVDDNSGTIIGKTIDASDEYDVWSALIDFGVLTDGCELLSFSLDSVNKTIDLDFNSATGNRIRSMGTTGETEIIGCIVNTYLEAYDCDGIKLTEEGKNLQTSHGANFDGYMGIMTF
ncbi:GerMN domain-containing protein [Mediterraneibacter glycyrrhizinilyticus]|nr:GerMN domain-containing protein [Mediterraneibacter glycyrrhizinilyticus]MBM6804439.1 GerMN domain-containing protein [Mediterraneibacter glycyrrhizinilyticus]